MTILAWDGKKLATDTAITTTQGGAVFTSPMDCFKLHSMNDLQRGREYHPDSYSEIRNSKIRNIATCGSSADAELLISFVLSRRDLTYLIGRGKETIKPVAASLLLLTCDGSCYHLSTSPDSNNHGMSVLRLKEIRKPLYLAGSGRSMNHVIKACRVDDAVVAVHLISRLDDGCGGRIVWTDTTDQEILISYFENGEMRGDQRYKDELEGKLDSALIYFRAFMNGGIVPVVDHTPEELEQRKKERAAMAQLDKEFNAKAREVMEAIKATPKEPEVAATEPATEVEEAKPPVTPAEAANDPVAA